MSPARLIWSQVIWRQWKREPSGPVLLGLILALGVAVFLSVRLANRAAVSGFSFFTESLSGESDLLLRPRAGQFSESDLMDLRESTGSLPLSIFPVLEAPADAGPGPEAAVYRIVGVDLASLANAIPSGGKDETHTLPLPSGDFGNVLNRPDRVFVSDEAGHRIGDRLVLYLEGTQKEVEIAGLLKSDPLRPEIPQSLLLMDLPGAQLLSGNKGLVSRIEIRIPPGPDFAIHLEEAEKRLGEWGGNRFVLETPGERKNSFARMSAAFRLNLTILSTLALVVGAYLILQAMEAAVIKRRREIAILRCLGVTPRQIGKAWLAESFVLGALGSTLGVALGYFLAQGMVRGIAATVNTLYHDTTAQSAAFDLKESLLAFSFGLVVSLIAGWLPAREASRVAPSRAATQGSRGGGLKFLRRPLLGFIFSAVALLLAFLPPLVTARGTVIPLAGYGSAFLFLLGFSILAGLIFRPVGLVLRGNQRHAGRSYAASQFRLPGGRHRLAAAGLLAAFGMSAAMGILVASFEGTITAWIAQMLRADLYLAPAGSQTAVTDRKISENQWNKVLATPGIAGYDRLRRHPITLNGEDVWLAGADYNESDRQLEMIWIDPPVDPSPSSLRLNLASPSVPAWISEPFSLRFQRKKGDEFEIPTPQGPRQVRVLGIYADYGSERGTILLSREHSASWFNDQSLSNLALYLDPGIDPEKWRADLEKEFPAILIRSNRALREDALRLFHRTFSVTHALEGIAVVIAVAGLGLAMAGLLLERKEDLRTLKEIGLSRNRIARAAMWEGMGLGLVGIIGGFALSLILGWLLVFVINRQSFGWTLDFSIPWLSIIALGLAMLATGGGVSWLAGRRAAQLKSDRKE